MHRNPLIATLVLLLSLLTVSVHASEDVININTATLEQLASLDGIGESKAEAIVAYRDSHGPFQSPAELANVRGIGERTVSKNADRLTVE